MSYYHILLELKNGLSSFEQSRDVEIYNITDLKPYLHAILLPYFNEQEIELEDENIAFDNVLHLSIKQTLLPIEHLVEEEQKLLPSDTDITISAYEIFNDQALAQDVTVAIFDVLEAVKLDPLP